MLLSISLSTEKFIPLAGLRSLLVSDTDASGRGGGVVTRTIAASCGEVVQESGVGEGIDDYEEEEEEDEGCWVSYGRRDPRRRLPPPIPSLAARSTLRRMRTEDRRLVIAKVPVMRPDFYVRSRRRRGRLVMQLVEREDDSDPLPAPADPLPVPSALEDDIAQRVDNSTTAATAVEEDARDVHTTALPAAPSPLPAVGCFEDVVKYQYSIGSSPLHQMPMLRMVH